MAKKKSAAAVELGRKGGLAKVPKGLARMPVEKADAIRKAAANAKKRR